MAFHTSQNHISAGIVVSHSLKIVIFLDACWYILGRNLSCAVIVIKHSQKKRRLVDHIAIHTGEKPFHKSKCDKLFTRNSESKYHLENLRLVHTGVENID